MVSAETLFTIRRRLDKLGYDTNKHSIEDLDFFADLIYDVVTADLCRDTIPPQLYRVYIDMVCGEFLYDKFVKGDLDDWFGDGIDRGDLTRVSLGDMEVHFDGILTAREIFLDNVNYLRKHPDYRYLFDIFRDYLR